MQFLAAAWEPIWARSTTPSRGAVSMPSLPAAKRITMSRCLSTKSSIALDSSLYSIWKKGSGAEPQLLLWIRAWFLS